MTENVVVEILRVVQADLAAVKADLAAVKTDLAAVKTDVAGVKLNVTSHTSLLNILLQDTREIRSVVNDIERTRVSAGEIGALHHDVNHVQ